MTRLSAQDSHGRLEPRLRNKLIITARSSLSSSAANTRTSVPPSTLLVLRYSSKGSLFCPARGSDSWIPAPADCHLLLSTRPISPMDWLLDILDKVPAVPPFFRREVMDILGEKASMPSVAFPAGVYPAVLCVHDLSSENHHSKLHLRTRRQERPKDASDHIPSRLQGKASRKHNVRISTSCECRHSCSGNRRTPQQRQQCHFVSCKGFKLTMAEFQDLTNPCRILRCKDAMAWIEGSKTAIGNTFKTCAQ